MKAILSFTIAVLLFFTTPAIAGGDSSPMGWINGSYSGTAESGWRQCWKFSVKGDKITGSMERSKRTASYFENLTDGYFEGSVAVVKVMIGSRERTYRITLESPAPNKTLKSVSSHKQPVTNILKPGC